ncbi:hypothetical protein ACFOEK_07565 [Litoribrevibacter euphylliae]|uniref:Uncharacterized protein n=1 Tax=Litoribrevibacter euphylliae TaxID=1834034 RepID=A0ABV7HEJ9_9GAMM
MSNDQLDAVSLVRKRPRLFIDGLDFNAEKFCGRYTSQALILGAKSVRVVRYNNVWIIASDFNWLSENPNLSDMQSPFFQVISDEKLGQNSFYQEIVLTAFCEFVGVYQNGEKAFDIGAFEFNVPSLDDEILNAPLCVVFKSKSM